MSMKPQATDLYAILGLSPYATQAQLSHAYRALLRRHHPDTRTVEHGRSDAADAALQEVLTAYAVLHDPTRRADYDRLRGLTAPGSTRQAVRIHQAHTDPTTDAPIQAGPVHWHRQPGR
jgi:DnaJ-class molecular chaperone